eukprot:CAMPEP_0204871442 /NCGR_PEP_ID=MMETSP1348-20121228/35408_1 /ASSEMBLY_ACC=CAM_ASM_000700 /TAXON_ID=215587 /ORGANISM="Aplanochytrium stocchinoi, Strain GSBS06" /LENGTH=832 /DNA_ID=CAMNT_0052025733 /DNA_START=236 /DNA_END=2734 /DNA_ORIENTATION=-
MQDPITNSKESTWYKFDDENVVRVKERRAVNSTFGGEYSSRDIARAGTKKFSNAYMLVYIQKCMLEQVLPPVDDAQVSSQLVQRFEEELMLEEKANKEKTEMRQYAHLRIVRERDLLKFHKYSSKQYLKTAQNSTSNQHHVDFVNYPETELVLKVRKDSTPTALYNQIAAALGVTKKAIRLWRCVDRENQTRRVDSVISRRDDITPITKALESTFISMDKPGEVFCEELIQNDDPNKRKNEAHDGGNDNEISEVPLAKRPRLDGGNQNEGLGLVNVDDDNSRVDEVDVDDDAEALFGEDDDCDRLTKNSEVLLFIRYFDKEETDVSKMIKHLGHVIVDGNATFGEVAEISKAKFPILINVNPEKCTVSEILTPSRFETHVNSHTLNQSDMQNGDILVIEQVDVDEETNFNVNNASRFKAAKDWINYCINHVSVDFYHIDKPAARMCTLELEFRMGYENVVKHLNDELKKLNLHYDSEDEGMRIHLLCTPLAEPNYDVTRSLRKVAEPSEEEIQQRRFALYYELLPCRIDQLHPDRQIIIKVTVLRGYENSETISFVVPADATVEGLAVLIRKQLSIPDACVLHLFQIYAGRFDRELNASDPVNTLNGNRRHKSRIIAEVHEEVDLLDIPHDTATAATPAEDSENHLNSLTNGVDNAMDVTNRLEVANEPKTNTILVLVCHFYTREEDKSNPRAILFDFPFTLRVHHDETVEEIRKRIEKRVKMPDEKFQELKLVGFLRGAMERFKELENGEEKLLENKSMFPGSTAQEINTRPQYTTQVPMLGLMHSSKDAAQIDVHADFADDFNGSPVYAVPQRNDAFRDIPSGGLTIRSS